MVMSVALGGCVTLKSVTDYSAASRKTLEGVQTVGRDYSASCLRMQQYKALPAHGPAMCVKEKIAAKGIADAAQAFDAYMSGLAALAADDTVGYDSQIDGLVASVKNANIMPNSQVEAIGGLAKILSRAALDGYKQKQLRIYLDEADPHVSIASKALADVVGKLYALYIKGELEKWDIEYTDLERSQKKLKPLEWQIYADRKWPERVELEAKIAAADSLAKSMLAIGTAHAELRTNADKLDAKELSALIKAYVDATLPVIKEVKEAFK